MIWAAVTDIEFQSWDLFGLSTEACLFVCLIVKYTFLDLRYQISTGIKNVRQLVPLLYLPPILSGFLCPWISFFPLFFPLCMLPLVISQPRAGLCDKADRFSFFRMKNEQNKKVADPKPSKPMSASHLSNKDIENKDPGSSATGKKAPLQAGISRLPVLAKSLHLQTPSDFSQSHCRWEEKPLAVSISFWSCRFPYFYLLGLVWCV